MEGQVLPYDSLGQPKAALTPELEEQIVAFNGTTAGQGGVLEITMPIVQKQRERLTADVLRLLGQYILLIATSLKP